MAITATALTTKAKPAEFYSREATPFIVNGYTADASGGEVLKAAPGSGKFIVVQQLTVVCMVKDITVTIGAGETGGNPDSVIWGPLPFVAEETAAGYLMGAQYTWRPVNGIWLAADTELIVDASGAGAVCVTAEGFVI